MASAGEIDVDIGSTPILVSKEEAEEYNRFLEQTRLEALAKEVSRCE